MTNLDNPLNAECSSSKIENVDVFTCGRCGTTCGCILEFIQHKIAHEVTDDSLFRCRLCKHIAKELKALFHHYQLQHGIFKGNSWEMQSEKSDFSSLSTFKTDENSREEQTICQLDEDLIKDMYSNNFLKESDTDNNILKEDSTLHVNIIQKESTKNDFHFILIAEFVQGKKIKYKRITFKCLHCDLKTYSRLTLCKHVKEKHPEMIGINPSLEIINREIDEKHRLMSMFEYISQFCQTKTCDQQTKIKKYKKNIDKREHTETFPCEMCGKVFSKLKYLRKHSVIHKTENPYICGECGKKFKSKTYLQVHVRRHGDRTYSCSQCDFRSSIKASILAHRQIHRAGSVLCEICGFAYTGKQTLAKHMEVHDLSRPFGCTFPGCSWRFKTEMMCKAHIKAHTTEGKFKCSMCGYVFRRKHHLQRHERKMHGIQVTKSCSTWKDHCSLKDNLHLNNDFSIGINSQNVSLLNKIDSELHSSSDLCELMRNDDSETVLMPQIDSNHEVEISSNQSDIKSLELDTFQIENVDEVPSSSFMLTQNSHFSDKSDLMPLSVEEIVHSSIDTLIGVTAVVIDNGQILLEPSLSMDI